MYRFNYLFNKHSLKNVKTWLPYFILFGLCLGTFFKPVADMDELWNYNFARCIYNGLTPYADFNILQTPFASYLSALFLGIFGNNLYVFRCIGFGLLFFTLSLLFDICFLISGNRVLSLGFTLLSFSVSFLWWTYNYNFFILFLVLLIIRLEYFRCEKALNNASLFLNTGTGLLVGLILLVKQSTGLVFLLANAILCFVEWNKEKQFLKVYFLRFISSLVPTILYILFLIISGNFWNFYDYTIAGIGDFTHSVSFINYIFNSPVAFFVGIFPVATIIYWIFSFCNNRLRVSWRFGLSLVLLSLAGCAVAYPLCDNQHFPIAFIPFVLCLLSCRFDISSKGIVTGFAVLTFLASIIVASLPALIYSEANGYAPSQLNHFENLPIRKGLEDNILLVDSFISEKEEQGVVVYIADSNAAGYMIPLDRYNKDFDLLMRGNLGTKSIDTLLKDKFGSIILVRQDERDLNYQSHFELIRYIKGNFERVDEVAGFEAYNIR